MSEQLFRSQALQALAMTKFGEPIFYQPVALKFFSIGAAVFFSVFLIFVVFIPFKSLEGASGVLTLSEGSVDVFSAKPGVLSTLYVMEGQFVKKGEPLALLNNEAFDAVGRNGIDQKLSFIDEQIVLLSQRKSILVSRSASEQAQQRVGLSSLQRELGELKEQQVLIESKVALSETSYSRDASLWRKEMLSDATFERSSDAYLTAQLQAKSSALLLLSKEQAVNDARARIDLGPLNSLENLLALDREILLLRAQRQELLALSTFSIVSPRDGVIGNIAPIVGDQVEPSYPLLKVLSPEQRFEVHLYVASRAVGRLKIGQIVLLSFDALPSELYGRLRGEVASISAEAITIRNDSATGAGQEPVYLVKATIDKRQFLGSVFSRLRSGMGVSAKIVTGEKTLLARLLSPLESFEGRL
jgi:membrane fusion protein